MKRFTFSLLFFLMIITASGQNIFTVNISWVINKSNPPSYTFSTDFKGEAGKSIWYFGDEGSSEQLTPTHFFKYSKSYLVQVKIIDKSNNVWYGKAEARFEGASVLTTACKALFTFAVTPATSTADAVLRKVTFTNKSTGTLKACTWTFGDGSSSTIRDPEHTYAKYGEYKVCLIIETTDGCKSDYCAWVKLIDPNVPVILYGKGYVKDLSSVEQCKWGIVIDNTTVLLPVEMAVPFEFKAGQQVELAYELMRNTVTACQAGKPVKIHKIAEIPVVSPCKAYFTATNALWSDPAMMKKMVFYNQSVGDIKNFLWKFGDGTTSTEPKPVHEYPAFGEYLACLSVETYSGCTSEYCAPVKVAGNTMTNTCSFDLVIKPKDMTTNAYLFYAISKSEIKTWKWSFGDGKTGEAQNPDHTYEKPGVYEVTCTITTGTGCTATRTIRLTVQAPALPICPGAIKLTLFSPSGTVTVCNGKAVVSLVDAEMKDYPEVKYTWSTGATGNTAENLCPNKQYVVQAVVANICQKNTSFSFLTSPVFRVETTNGKYSFNVDSPAEGIIYRWEFGDGNVAYGPAVDYNFTKEGEYDVKLTAISGDYSAASSQKVAVLDQTTAIKDIREGDVRIYPNPVRDRLRIDFYKPVTGTVDIQVIDMKGQKAMIQNLNLNGQRFVEMDTQQLNDGIFFLRINSNGNVFTGLKFLKSK